MRKIIGSETTYFFYALGSLLCEFTSTNTGATQAAATDRLQYQSGDKLGSAVLIMSGSLVVENNRTLPFGELWNAQVASNNDKKFTTYQRDSESGLDYAMARLSLLKMLSTRYLLIETVLKPVRAEMCGSVFGTSGSYSKTIASCIAPIAWSETRLQCDQ